MQTLVTFVGEFFVPNLAGLLYRILFDYFFSGFQPLMEPLLGIFIEVFLYIFNVPVMGREMHSMLLMCRSAAFGNVQ